MSVNRPPSLRTEQVRLTRQRIIDAAEALLLAKGYASTTLQAVAAAAGVAVETVYARFGNKTSLLGAILEDGIVGADRAGDVLDQPEIRAIRASTDQCEQVRLLASYSRGILARTDTAHRILRSAAAVDDAASQMQQQDTIRRIEGQRFYVKLLLANGPLREGLTETEAADVYSALASPDTYAFLVGTQGWTADRFESWLADTLACTLLSQP
jgi:AcrR family transcriptional regulator